MMIQTELDIAIKDIEYYYWLRKKQLQLERALYYRDTQEYYRIQNEVGLTKTEMDNEIKYLSKQIKG